MSDQQKPLSTLAMMRRELQQPIIREIAYLCLWIFAIVSISSINQLVWIRDWIPVTPGAPWNHKSLIPILLHTGVNIGVTLYLLSVVAIRLRWYAKMQASEKSFVEIKNQSDELTKSRPVMSITFQVKRASPEAESKPEKRRPRRSECPRQS